jgi:hypothetical protein
MSVLYDENLLPLLALEELVGFFVIYYYKKISGKKTILKLFFCPLRFYKWKYFFSSFFFFS